MLEPFDIENEDGAERMSGTSVQLYYAPVSFFDLIPRVKKLPDTIDEAIVIDTDFGFKAGKFWRKLTITIGTGSVIDELVGNRDNAVYFSTLQFQVPGTKKHVLAFSALVKDDDFIFLVVEPDGAVRILGNGLLPGKIYPGVSREADFGSYVGLSARVEAFAPTPSPIYTGFVQLAATTGDFNDDFNDDFNI